MHERISIYIAITLGAIIGATLRYETAKHFSKNIYANLIAVSSVNLVGSFLIGLAFVLLQLHSGKQLPLFILTGFLGSLTTFSTFSLETVKLLQNGQWKLAMTFSFGQVLLSILLCFLGIMLGRYLAPFLR